MPEAKPAQMVDRIVAIVNDNIITLYELNQAIKPYADRIKAMGYSYDKEQQLLYMVRKDVLNKLIDNILTDQEVKKTNISISDNEIDNTIENIKAANYNTDEDLRAILKNQGITMNSYRKSIKEQLLRMRLINMKVKSKIVITEKDLNTYYQEHLGEYKKEKKYHLRNIIIKKEELGLDNEEKQKILNKMDAVLELLKQGQTFYNLEKKYSESSLAEEGGDLGFFYIDELSPVIQEKIVVLKKGEYTPVIDTDQGYQIFYIEEIIETKGKSFEEAKLEIEEKLYKNIINKKFRTWLEALRKKSHIKIIK